MAYINKILVSGTNYDIQDANLYNNNNNAAVFVDDDNTAGDKKGSTVLKSTSKNVNLDAEKNIQFKTKKGKIIFDTTSTITSSGDNEVQLISKVKDDTHNGTEYYKAENDSYKGDHSNVLIEAGRVRIKPYNVPKWESTDSVISSAVAKRKIQDDDMRDGYLFLDTGGMEDGNYGGTSVSSGSEEPSFFVKVGNNGVDQEGITTGKYRPLVIQSRGVDLRQMSHGGIALQPCGYDNPGGSGEHYENKIKFESSRIADIYEMGTVPSAYQKGGKWVKGGDGLEFGTFNNMHTSLFTRDYRFNKDGVVYAVGREVQYRDSIYKVYFKKVYAPEDYNIKYVSLYPVSYSGTTKKFTEDNGGEYVYLTGTKLAVNSSGQYLKFGSSNTPAIVESASEATVFGVWDKADYITQNDDFKDIINNSYSATWYDIVKTSFAMNGNKDRHVKITSNGNLEIQTNKTFNITDNPEFENVEDLNWHSFSNILYSDIDKDIVYSESEIVSFVTSTIPSGNTSYAMTINIIEEDGSINEDAVVYVNVKESPNLNIKSSKKIQLTAEDNIELTSASKIKLGGELDFGSTFNYGETDNGIEYQYKYTSKGKVKDCSTVKIVGVNNSSNTLTVNGVEIPAGESVEIVSATMFDIILLVNWMKENNQGPWAA